MSEEKNIGFLLLLVDGKIVDVGEIAQQDQLLSKATQIIMEEVQKYKGNRKVIWKGDTLKGIVNGSTVKQVEVEKW